MCIERPKYKCDAARKIDCRTRGRKYKRRPRASTVCSSVIHLAVFKRCDLFPTLASFQHRFRANFSTIVATFQLYSRSPFLLNTSEYHTFTGFRSFIEQVWRMSWFRSTIELCSSACILRNFDPNAVVWNLVTHFLNRVTAFEPLDINSDRNFPRSAIASNVKGIPIRP